MLAGSTLAAVDALVRNTAHRNQTLDGKVLAEAKKLETDGYPLAKEIITASKNLPDDQEQLKTLAMKLETAQAFFVKAKDTYASVKDEAPASADVTGRIAKIEKILSILQNAADGLKSRLK